MRKILAVLLAIFFSSSALAAQTKPETKPEPYGKDEFPEWMEDLRRAEIIAVGSFPLTLYASNMGYSLYRWSSFGFDGDYSVDFLGNSVTPLDSGERLLVLGIAAGSSVAMALADYIIEQIIRYGKRQE
jgi:hypothetical protein